MFHLQLADPPEHGWIDPSRHDARYCRCLACVADRAELRRVNARLARLGVATFTVRGWEARRGAMRGWEARSSENAETL